MQIYVRLTDKENFHWICLINHGSAGWFLYDDNEVNKVDFELLNQFFRDASYLYYIDSNELLKEENLVVQFDQVNLSEEDPQI
jgi:hypothetical protein